MPILKTISNADVPELQIADGGMTPGFPDFNVDDVRGCFPGRRKMYLAAVSVYFGSLAMGTVLGYSSPALHDMEHSNSRIKPTEEESAWIGSIMTVGAFIGSIVAGPLTERVGLRATLVFSVAPFLGGWLFIAFAKSVWALLVGRLITGFCCGVVSLAVPVYLAEISTPQRRGIIGAGFQTTVVVGVLITYAIGSVISWVNLALFSAVFPIIMSAMMLAMPETPRWLISKKRKFEAMEAIYFLQGGHVEPQESCYELQEVFDQQPKGNVALREFLQPHIFKPVSICLMIMFFQQWSGINGIMFYASTLFTKSGYTKIDAASSSIILAAAQVIGTLIGAAIIDRLGRKILLLASSALMILGLTILSVLFGIAYTTTNQTFMEQFGWVDVAGLSIYVLSFAIGYGPIPWVIMSELIPTRVKGPAGSMATFFNWACAFLVTYQFQNMITKMDYGAYIFFDVICVLGLIFVVVFLPETKGKSLDDIEALFNSNLDAVTINEDYGNDDKD